MKQVLPYAMSESLEVDFVLEMVEQLVQNHGASLNKSFKYISTGEYPTGMLPQWVR